MVLTSGLAALALGLALLQAAVIAHGTRQQTIPTARAGATNRYSAPGNRSAVPWGAPFDNKDPAQKPVPAESPEGRSPERRQQQEEHRSPPPPSRFRGMPPRLGPQPARKAAA